MIPIHPIHNVQDWDAPATAIDWPRFIGALRQIKENGEIPSDHQSYEDLNQNPAIEMDEGVRDQWKEVFTELQEAKGSLNERIVWVLVDGFLMYWKPVSVQWRS